MPMPIARCVILSTLPALLTMGSCSNDPAEPGPEVVVLSPDTESMPPVASPAQPSGDPQAATSSPSGPAAELIARGDAAFNAGFCVKCHQTGGIGGVRAPNLTDDQWVHCDGTVQGIAALIRSGVPKAKLSRPDYPFAMNSAEKMNLDDATVEALAAYVWNLSQ